MGFFIVEEIKIQELGVSVSNSYITVKGTYNCVKKGNGFYPTPMGGVPSDKPYHLQATYYIFATNNNELKPLRTETVYYPIDELPLNNNNIKEIYDKIKADKFSNLTYTDDI